MNETLEALRNAWRRVAPVLETAARTIGAAAGKAARAARSAAMTAARATAVAARRAWRGVVAFIANLRAPRRREVDPSTPAPVSDPSGRVTVVARADDGILSLVERIEAAGGPEVVLVVPREARVLRDPAAWPHIAAVAKRHALALGVVASRGDVRSYARQNGLPATTSVGRVVRAPHHRLRVGDREFYVPRIPWGGLVRATVLVGGLYLVGIVACNTIPSAEIVVVPASEEVSTSARMRLNPIATEPDLELGVQPATSFQHEFTHTIAILTSGEVEVPDERATVILQFSNTTEAEAIVRAGSQVDDENGISFATDADVTVPPGSIATASATAVQAGTQANVPFGTLILSDDLPAGLTATNPASAEGGTDKTVPAVDETDVVRVALISDEVLRRIGERELFAAVTEGTVFPQTISVSIFSQEALANPGDPAETFLVDYTAIVTALVVSEEQAALTAEALLLDRLEEGRALLPGSATATLDDARVEAGTVTVRLTATGLVADVIDTTLVREAISGDSPETARIEIEAMLALEGPPQITLRPALVPWRWLPRNADRITITLAGPASLVESDTEADDDATEDSSLLRTATDATPTAEP